MNPEPLKSRWSKIKVISYGLIWSGLLIWGLSGGIAHAADVTLVEVSQTWDSAWGYNSTNDANMGEGFTLTDDVTVHSWSVVLKYAAGGGGAPTDDYYLDLCVYGTEASPCASSLSRITIPANTMASSYTTYSATGLTLNLTAGEEYIIWGTRSGSYTSSRRADHKNGTGSGSYRASLFACNHILSSSTTCDNARHFNFKLLGEETFVPASAQITSLTQDEHYGRAEAAVDFDKNDSTGPWSFTLVCRDESGNYTFPQLEPAMAAVTDSSTFNLIAEMYLTPGESWTCRLVSGFHSTGSEAWSGTLWDEATLESETDPAPITYPDVTGYEDSGFTWSATGLEEVWTGSASSTTGLWGDTTPPPTLDWGECFSLSRLVGSDQNQSWWGQIGIGSFTLSDVFDSGTTTPGSSFSIASDGVAHCVLSVGYSALSTIPPFQWIDQVRSTISTAEETGFTWSMPLPALIFGEGESYPVLSSATATQGELVMRQLWPSYYVALEIGLWALFLSMETALVLKFFKSV